MTKPDTVVLVGETTSSSLLRLRKSMYLSTVKHGPDAIKTLEIEIFQLYSELGTVIHPSASKWPWTPDSNMLVCNTEASVGQVIPWASMEKDQTQNVT